MRKWRTLYKIRLIFLIILIHKEKKLIFPNVFLFLIQSGSFQSLTIYTYIYIYIYIYIYVCVGLTSTTLSRRLTMHLSDTISMAQHLKKTFMPNNTITENSHRQHILRFSRTRNIYIYIYIYISILHLRCMREVFSDALSSLPISGNFCIISAPTVTSA